MVGEGRHDTGEPTLGTRRPAVPTRSLVVDVVVVALLAATGTSLLIWRAAMLPSVGTTGRALFAVEAVTVAWLVLTAVLFSGRVSARPDPPAPASGMTLDVVIPVAGEPIAMVEQTIRAALAIDWPANVVVCNDGRMADSPDAEAVIALCRGLGVTCLTRSGGERGKAGNLNHALPYLRGEFLLVLDADHRVRTDVARQLLGYFRHSEIAFVTTPQEFLDSDRDTLNPTEPVFYRATQPARDRHGLAFSTGNGVVYRRSAVVGIGGFSEWSVVEDLHTSIRLHAAGWRSVFHPWAVSVGLAPRTSAEYARQRVRWSVDSLRILFLDPPWRRRGLSATARLFYTHTLVSYLVVMVQVGFLLGPPAWILGRLSMLHGADWQDQVRHIGPWLAVVALTLIRWAGWRGAVRSLRLATAFQPLIFWAALMGIVSRTVGRGGVTRKVHQPRFNGIVLSAQLLPVGLVAAMVWAVFDPRPGGSDLAMVWAAVLASIGVGPMLRFGGRQVAAGALQATVVVVAVSLAAGSIAVSRFGWEPPQALYRSFEPVDPSLRDATIVVNDFGSNLVLGPAIPAPEPTPPPTGGDGDTDLSEVAAGVTSAVTHVSLARGDGAYVGFASDPLPYDLADVDRWADEVTEPQIVHWYQQWGSGDSRFRGDWLAEVADDGRIPMISWEAWAKPEGSYTSATQALGRMDDIAAGVHDEYIDSWAEAAADYGRPILLRPFHEMNGFWYPWSVGVNGNSADDYVAGWRHVVDRFDAAGADNVGFVWSINTLASFEEGQGVEAYYPGDAYVDWVATSGFNWDDYDPEWSSWVSAEWVFGNTYDVLAGFGKPVMFAEIGSGTNGGDGEAWVAEAAAWFATLPEVGAIVWFDRTYDGRIDFRLLPEQQVALADAVDRHDELAPPLAYERHVTAPRVDAAAGAPVDVPDVGDAAPAEEEGAAVAVPRDEGEGEDEDEDEGVEDGPTGAGADGSAAAEWRPRPGGPRAGAGPPRPGGPGTRGPD